MSGNFGDFNFGDDVPSPDTDPTPDVVDDAPSDDGIQNDVTNYPEPGEGDEIKGEDVSVFDTESNPEEIAQEDEIPPVISDKTSIHDRMREYNDAAKDYNDKWYDGERAKNKQEKEAETVADNIRHQNIKDLIREYNQDDSYLDEEDPRIVFERIQRRIADYNEDTEIYNASIPSVRDMIDEYNALPDESASVREMFDAYSNIDDYSFNDELVFDEDTDDSIVITNEVAALLDELDAFDTAAIEQFDADVDLDDLAIVPGSDGFANTETNPSGIGELFDSLILADFDIFKNSEFPSLNIDDLFGGAPIDNFELFELASLDDILFFDSPDEIVADQWSDLEDWSGLF